MDKRDLLKSMLTNFIQDRNEEAHADIHDYLTTKFQEVSGVESSQSFDFVPEDIEIDEMYYYDDPSTMSPEQRREYHRRKNRSRDPLGNRPAGAIARHGDELKSMLQRPESKDRYQRDFTAKYSGPKGRLPEDIEIDEITEDQKDSNRMSIDLDFADWTGSLSDAQMDKNTHLFALRFKCEAKLKKRIGPGGGNPVYTITGKETDLRRLYADYIGERRSKETDEEFDEFFM